MNWDNLAARAASVQSDYESRRLEEDAVWQDSPFDWMRRYAARSKGKIGSDLARGVFEDAGYKPGKRGENLEVENKIVQTRTSLLWSAGVWKFQQIRNTEFDFTFCLGLLPQAAYAWLVPKTEIFVGNELQEREGSGWQHGGNSGREDVWVVVNPESCPSWLSPYGGPIESISKAFERYL